MDTSFGARGYGVNSVSSVKEGSAFPLWSSEKEEIEFGISQNWRSRLTIVGRAHTLVSPVVDSG